MKCITLKQFKKKCKYASLYGAVRASLMRMCRESKVKFIPARAKKRIAMRVRQQVKDIAFMERYAASHTIISARRGGKSATKSMMLACLDYVALERRLIESGQSYLMY